MVEKLKIRVARVLRSLANKWDPPTRQVSQQMRIQRYTMRREKVKALYAMLPHEVQYREESEGDVVFKYRMRQKLVAELGKEIAKYLEGAAAIKHEIRHMPEGTEFRAETYIWVENE